ASYDVNGHRETWPIRSKSFCRYLKRIYCKRYGKTPCSQALQDCLDVLETKALDEGAEKKIYIRLVEHEGAIYLDLVNKAWEAVSITAEGWSVIQTPPIPFRRAAGMLPLPTPVQGGAIDDLRRSLNAKSEDAWILLRAWLLSALRPVGPFPVLALHG